MSSAKLKNKYKVNTPADGTAFEYIVTLDQGSSPAIIEIVTSNVTPNGNIVLTLALSPIPSPPGGVVSGSTGVEIDVLVRPG